MRPILLAAISYEGELPFCGWLIFPYGQSTAVGDLLFRCSARLGTIRDSKRLIRLLLPSHQKRNLECYDRDTSPGRTRIVFVSSYYCLSYALLAGERAGSDLPLLLLFWRIFPQAGRESATCGHRQKRLYRLSPQGLRRSGPQRCLVAIAVERRLRRSLSEKPE